MDRWILINDCLLVAGGVVLLLVGILGQRAWRGRLIAWSPCCRRCGFDLRGHAGGSCPECGADLGRPGSITEGLRRHRTGLMAGAGALLVLAIAMLCSARFNMPARAWAWWLENRPVWAMEGVLRDQDDVAWASIDNRDRAGALSDADLRFVMAIALDLPTNNGQFVTPSWGWLVNQHASGRISTATLKPVILRTLETMDPGLRFMPAGQRAGAPVELTANQSVPPAVGDLDPVQVLTVEALIDGSWVPLGLERPAASMRGSSMLRQSGGLAFKAPAVLGAHELRATIKLTVREPAANLFQRGNVLVECERTVTLGTLRVLDPAATFAMGAHDEAFHARLYPLLNGILRGFTPMAGSTSRARTSGTGALAPNEGFDFDIEGVQSGLSVALGRIWMAGGVQTTELRGRAGIDHTQPWTLRLVPRLDRIEPTLLEPTRVYDGIIEFPRGPIDADGDAAPSDDDAGSTMP
jgi:hypothetical protein